MLKNYHLKLQYLRFENQGIWVSILNSLWKHSCGVAIALNVLAKDLNLSFLTMLISCGLCFMTLEKLQKLKFSQKQFFRELRHAKRYDCSLIESERTLAKLEHDKLGAFVG